METILSIIAIVISMISGGFALYTFFWTAARDRKQATLDAYNQHQEQALDHLNYYMPAQIAEIEHFCVGVNQKIYDSKTVYELAHGYLDGGIKNRIEPIIEKKNKSGHDYYANIHQVYDWMEAETEKQKKKASRGNKNGKAE